MAYIYDLADTWNDGATTFNGIRLNVTDTASAAGSRLMDLQVGGVSQLRVVKNGVIDFQNGLSAVGPLLTNGVYLGTTGAHMAGVTTSGVEAGFFKVQASGAIGFSGVAGAGNSGDVFLRRDAANTLAQRNGTNAQALRVYNTFTDASNGEWAAMRWSSNDLLLGVQANGTGTTNRQMHYQASAHRFFVGSGAATPSWTINADGSLTYVGTASGFIGLVEQTAPAAPATNGVRIYAEDDGAGKTRLMARFATGAAVQIAIEP